MPEEISIDIDTHEDFKLAEKIETQLLADLEKYDIQDKSTLKDYYWDLYAAAMAKKDYKKASECINKRINYLFYLRFS